MILYKERPFNSLDDKAKKKKRIKIIFQKNFPNPFPLQKNKLTLQIRDFAVKHTFTSEKATGPCNLTWYNFSPDCLPVLPSQWPQSLNGTRKRTAGTALGESTPWHEALLLDPLKLLGAQVLLLASRWRVLHWQATQLLFSHIFVCEIQSPELSQSLAAEPTYSNRAVEWDWGFIQCLNMKMTVICMMDKDLENSNSNRSEYLHTYTFYSKHL